MAQLPALAMQELLSYDSKTGDLFWKPRARKWFASDKSMKTWNTRFAGKKVFLRTFKRGGYLRIDIFHHAYRAHRVCFAVAHGMWPNLTDHANGITTENNFKNISSVTHIENSRNRKIKSNNKSGFTGVYLDPKCKKWRANIHVASKTIHLGIFNEKMDAVRARAAANIKYGFHPNHGRKAA